MLENRSMPSSGVIPVLTYPDVIEASKWLCAAFGFRERLLIGTHRVQLHAGSGEVVVTGGAAREASRAALSVMIRVADAAAHFARAKSHGATIAQDLAGYVWTFSQTVSDVDPASWGGVLKEG